jgi:hypothetical protein
MDTGVHGKIGIHVQSHVVVDQGHDIRNVTIQSLNMGDPTLFSISNVYSHTNMDGIYYDNAVAT